ncbi:MAG: hypothetical protein EOO37_00365 [Cytophagaceae bacterium]|nr:MAG: hypothetical protein EOO37_00365 [Cytophagaceae bacterium]
MMRNALLLLLLLASGRASYSQTAPAGATGTPPDALQTFFTAPEKVLPRLYEAAIAHSSEIERLDALKSTAAEDVTLAKKRILNLLAFNSGYTYGSLPYFATATTTTTSSPTNPTPTTTTPAPEYITNPFGLGARAQFTVGAGLTVPIDVLASRNANIRRQQYVVDQTVAQRKTQETVIRQQIIIQYETLVLARATQQAAQDGYQSANISKKIADKRFRDGDIQIDEQMAAQDLYTRALLAQAEANSRYQTAQLLLEDMIGTSINNIMLGK